MQKNNKTNAKKNKTNGPSIGSSPGKWAPTFPKSSVWDLGWEAVPTTNPFLKIYVPCRVRNPNRTETHSCTYCMRGKFKNRKAWKPGNRDCISGTLPKCESSGCPKTFSAFAFFELTVYVYFRLFCIAFLHVHFLCFYFLHFLSAVVFVCIFKIFFFALHAAFFQDSNFPR